MPKAKHLEHPLFLFWLQLEKSIARIDYLESCDCKKSCMVNETLNRNIIKEDGEVWDLGCNQCKCKGGKVTCYERPCDPLTCRHPVFAKDECCPKCLSKKNNFSFCLPLCFLFQLSRNVVCCV